MIQQSYNGRDVNVSFPYGKRSATTLQKSELSKHYRCLHLLKSWKAILKKIKKSLPTDPNLEDHAIGNTRIFLFGLTKNQRKPKNILDLYTKIEVNINHRKSNLIMTKWTKNVLI